MKTKPRLIVCACMIAGWCSYNVPSAHSEETSPGLVLQVTSQTGETVVFSNAVLESWSDVVQIGNAPPHEVLQGFHLFPESTGELTIPWDRVRRISLDKQDRYQTPTNVCVYTIAGKTNVLGRLQEYSLDRHAIKGDTELGIRSIALEDVHDVVVLHIPSPIPAQ